MVEIIGVEQDLQVPDFLDKPQPRNKELAQAKAEALRWKKAYKDLAFATGCSVLVVVCMAIGYCAALF